VNFLFADLCIKVWGLVLLLDWEFWKILLSLWMLCYIQFLIIRVICGFAGYAYCTEDGGMQRSNKEAFLSAIFHTSFMNSSKGNDTMILVLQLVSRTKAHNWTTHLCSIQLNLWLLWASSFSSSVLRLSSPLTSFLIRNAPSNVYCSSVWNCWILMLDN